MDILFQQFRSKGHRLTRARKFLLTFFSEQSQPRSVEDICKALKKEGLSTDTSTVYREIAFLIAEHFLYEIDLGVGRKYYEKVSEHHHHLVCRSCHAVDDIDVDHCQQLFAELQNALEKQSGYQNLQHQLAFVGLCSTCL